MLKSLVVAVALLIRHELVLHCEMQLVRVPEPQRVRGSDELWELERELASVITMLPAAEKLPGLLHLPSGLQ